MFARVQRAAKKGSKILGYFLFLVLFLLNVQIGFSDNQTGEIELLGMKIALFNDLYANVALPPGDGGGGGQTETCNASASCESSWGTFNVKCSASGNETECSGYDNSGVLCRSWYANGSLKDYSYKPCP